VVGINRPAETTEQETPVLNEQPKDILNVQTTQFQDIDSGSEISFKGLGSKDAHIPMQPGIELGEFLKRPVHLANYTWSTSWSDVSFNPWNLFLTNTAVSNKLQNFPYIRGKLKVKFVINSSPFYYGAIFAAYTPLSGYAYTYAGNTPNAMADYIRYSQQPGVWIYPHTATGGEMELPFLYFQDYLNITTAAATTNMGRINLLQYAPLRSANAATTNGCTITVYGWMEDVELCGFTSTAILQGGDEYEEAGGPVSGPASSLANWSRYFESIPVIGKFATATRIGSSAVSGIARLFGWSNTPVITDVMPMKNLPFHDMASAHISQPVSKFTLDPKAELSVSPMTVGMDGTDELSVAHLVQRESLLTSFIWNTTDTPGTLFFSAAVTPLLYDRGSPTAASSYTIAMVPMCWVARLFRYWHGDIIFRFKVIASRFHQGRMRIHWDPAGKLTSTSDVTNTTMTKIVDIASNDEIEMRIPYMQPVAWSDHMGGGDVSTANNFSTSAVSNVGANVHNGCLVVRCLNNLSAPVDTAPITVLVFVRGAENLQFANPIDVSSKFSYLQLQGDAEFEETSPEDRQRYLVNFGEPIMSLRPLMRRTAFLDSIPCFYANTTDLLQEHRTKQTRFPPLPGYTSQTAYWGTAKGVETPASNFAYNFCNMTTLAYIVPAFVCYRGSIRWHYNVNNVDDHGPSCVEVVRNPGNQVSTISSTSLVTSTGTTNSLFRGAVYNNTALVGASGRVLTNYEAQPGVSVEMPMMTNYRFCLTNPLYMGYGTSTDATDRDTYIVSVKSQPASSALPRVLDRYVGIGTDFNVHFFLSVPAVYYNGGAGSIPA